MFSIKFSIKAGFVEEGKLNVTLVFDFSILAFIFDWIDPYLFDQCFEDSRFVFFIWNPGFDFHDY